MNRISTKAVEQKRITFLDRYLADIPEPPPEFPTKLPRIRLTGIIRIPRGDRERIEWDTDVPGLGRRIRSKRRPVWIVQWRQNGRTIRRTLGRVESLNLDAARTAARELRTQQSATTAPPLRTSPKFADFAEVFLKDCAGRWKPSTLTGHRVDCRTILIPAFGAQRIDAITRGNVLTWFTGPQGGCNRSLSVLSSLMLHAETLGLRPEGSNPCSGLRRRKSGFKARYPTALDYEQLGRSLNQVAAQHPAEVAVIRFLALTGARCGEALGLRWTNIDGSRAVLPDSKTGPKTLWLAPPVQALLNDIPKLEGVPHVFAIGSRPICAQHLGDFWRKLRHDAGLDGFRLHDLRHGYASVGVSHGEDLRTMSGLLGHADYATTLGYAHLAEAPVAAAAQRVSRKLATALKPELSVRPIPWPSAWRPNVNYNPDSPEEKAWQRRIAAYRRSSQKPMEFCRRRNLDRDDFDRALRRFDNRRLAKLKVPPRKAVSLPSAPTLTLSVKPIPLLDSQPRSQTANAITAEEQAWQRQVELYRRRPQKLADFCREHNLDPAAFHQALCRFQERRRLKFEASSR